MTRSSPPDSVGHPCTCGNDNLHDANGDKVPQGFFVSCNCCKKIYCLHERCFPYLPGRQGIKISKSELAKKFVCKKCRRKQCDCGKSHYGSEPGCKVIKCSVGTKGAHWFYAFDKCFPNQDSKSKNFRCQSCVEKA